MPRYAFYAEAIHADWPAYPADHGDSYALDALGSFPVGTHFRIIDDIDQCLLLLAVEYIDRSVKDDPFSERHHHLALWEEDLRRIKSDALIEGFLTADDLRQREIGLARQAPPDLRDRALLSVSQFDWESSIDTESLSVLVATDGFSLSTSGLERLDRESPPNFPSELARRMSRLLAAELYDSAIREAAIFLETDLRNRTASSAYGQRLVSLYVKRISQKADIYGAFQRHIRGELRTFFQFVRNEFAHNFRPIARGRCHALLHRILSVYEMLDNADAGAAALQDITIGKQQPPQV